MSHKSTYYIRSRCLEILITNLSYSIYIWIYITISNVQYIYSNILLYSIYIYFLYSIYLDIIISGIGEYFDVFFLSCEHVFCANPNFEIFHTDEILLTNVQQVQIKHIFIYLYNICVSSYSHLFKMFKNNVFLYFFLIIKNNFE